MGGHSNSGGQMERMVGGGLAIALSCIVPYTAQAHDAARPDLDNWYANLHRKATPGIGIDFKCCSRSDCHKTDAELRHGQWYARLGERTYDSAGKEQWILGPYRPIPDDIIVKDEKGNAIANPEGEAVICHTVYNRDREGHVPWDAEGIYCFVPGPEG